MKTIKIKLSNEAYNRLIAYTEADNYRRRKPNYRTCKESAEYLVSCMTTPKKVPFHSNKKTMSFYYKKLNRQLEKNRNNP